MDFERHVEHHHYDIIAPYSNDIYKRIIKDRWNIFENKPIANASELCYTLRRLVNGDERRLQLVGDIIETHQKVIIFFNHTYEADLLIGLCNRLGVPVARWDGIKHELIPDTDRWAYILQYAAGDSGWNCIETDTIIFYSQNYSYKSTVQAAGRIDRMNTPFSDLYYYHVRSKSGIDNAIYKALKQKKKFNESAYFKNF
jgi:SNF2 family DNA or RNA helicase